MPSQHETASNQFASALNWLLALVLLAAACVHEFAWQAFPFEAQGDVRNVTQWLPMAAAMFGWVMQARHRSVLAACIAVAIFSLSTGLCSLAWLIRPFETLPGQAKCSEQAQLPLMLISALVAVVALRFAYRDKPPP